MNDIRLSVMNWLIVRGACNQMNFIVWLGVDYHQTLI